MTNLHTQAVVSSVPSYRVIPLTQDQVAIVDAADFEWLSQWNWYAKWSEGGECFYARRIYKNAAGKWSWINMETVIVCPRRGRLADHKSGDTLDNRRQNLREATKRQNAINRRRRCDNKTGHTGVCYDILHDRYRATISVRKKQRSLGYYKTLEGAVAARKAGERKYYGEFIRA